MMATDQTPAKPIGVVVRGAPQDRYSDILNGETLEFLAGLHRAFNDARLELLTVRDAPPVGLDDGGGAYGFRAGTQTLRESEWTVAAIPDQLADQRVTLTGGVDRGSLIDGLNAGAPVYVADIGDATSPTWRNLLDGQVNLRDRWRDELVVTDEGGPERRLGDDPAVLILSPRGWHLPETRILVDGEAMSAALFDFGLYAALNARAALAAGGTVCVRLSGIGHHLEARLWNEVLAHTETTFDLARNAIRTTVHVDTLPALFEMDEIIHELRHRVTALSYGPETLAASFITARHTRDGQALPDHASSEMASGFLRSGADLMLRTCHRRGLLAIAGTPAHRQRGGADDDTARALEAIVSRWESDAQSGFDGVTLSRPDWVADAVAVFNRLMPVPNQTTVARNDVVVGPDDLLEAPRGTRSVDGFRDNIRICLMHIAAWLSGEAAPQHQGLTINAAIAGLAQTEIWQRLHGEGAPDTEWRATPDVFDNILAEEVAHLREGIGDEAYDAGGYEAAVDLLRALVTTDTPEPLTLATYRMIA